MAQASHVFLSYHGPDRSQVLDVRRYLSEHGVQTFMDQHNLRAGQNWPRALEEALRDASAVAVFIGAQVGNWQWAEIGFALDRQAAEHGFAVIPILLDGADTSRSFLFLNGWVDLRGHLFGDAALGRLLEALAMPSVPIPPSAVSLNPYRGLQVFDEAHAPFFFGRQRSIEALFEHITVRRSNCVAVVGASGSGKSSVVRAGLVPKLRRCRPPQETWDVAVITPGARPWFRLADALGPLRFPKLHDIALDIRIDRMGSALQSGKLSLISLLERILQRGGPQHRLLLVIDQFEELFTLTSSSERTMFIERLLEALAVKGLVLLPVLRADFYGQAIDADPRLSELLTQNQLALSRLTTEELRSAIIEPAKLAGLQFDPGLPELLLNDAGSEPGNLPLLQHALLELYERGKDAGKLTAQAYNSFGGIRRAIANSAEREFQRAEQRGQGEGALVRRVFTQLVRLARADEGVEDTRRRVAVSALPSEAARVVDEFASPELRLLVKTSERLAPSEAGPAMPQTTVEVAHEAVIREWGRLKTWLNEDRAFYLWRQRLAQADEEYRGHAASAEYLLQGPMLKEAELRLGLPMPEPLSAAHLEFIQASVAERDQLIRQQVAREEQRRLENERMQAQLDQMKAQSLKAIAAQTLALRANLLANHRQRDTAGLLAALSLSIQETQEAKDCAIALLTGEFRSRVLRQDVPVLCVAFSPDGAYLACGGNAGALYLIDVLSGHISKGPLRGHTGSVSCVAFSPDGTRLVSGDDDHSLYLWDVQTGQLLLDLKGHKSAINSVAFSRDGKLIVSASANNALRLWDACSGAPQGLLSGAGRYISSVAFSPDGRRMVSGNADHTLRLWDMVKRKRLGKPLQGHENTITSVTFTPDGKRIVSGSADGTLRLWDAENGAPIGDPLRRHTRFVSSVAVNPAGTRILSGGADHTLCLWDARTGQSLGEPLRGHRHHVNSVAFDATGARMASASDDGTVRLWETHSQQPLGEVLRGHTGVVNCVGFSLRGSHIVSGSSDGTVRLWDAFRSVPLGEPLRGHESAVTAVAFIGDGSSIISASEDGTLRLWNAQSGVQIGEPLRGHTSPVICVAVSPDATRIASGSWDETVCLWDVKTGIRIAKPMRGHYHFVTSVCFSPDGKRLVSGSHDTTLLLWDAQTGAKLSEQWRGHTAAVRSVAFNHDGTLVMSGSEDDTLGQWEVSSGQMLAQRLGHDSYVSSVTVSPDGTRVVSASYDRTLRLWNGHTGHPIGQPLRAHEDHITAVAFSGDGRRIVSASVDGTLRLWDAALLESGPALRDLLSQTVHRNLTRAEWQHYVPESEAYRAVFDSLPLDGV